jgi:hypothetical protein
MASLTIWQYSDFAIFGNASLSIAVSSDKCIGAGLKPSPMLRYRTATEFIFPSPSSALGQGLFSLGQLVYVVSTVPYHPDETLFFQSPAGRPKCAETCRPKPALLIYLPLRHTRNPIIVKEFCAKK